MRDELRVPTERDLPPGRMTLRKDHLMREISRTEGGSHRRRISLAVLAPSAVLLLGATAVAANYLISPPPPETVAASVACYQEADLSASAAYKGSTGESPLDVCAKLWSSGQVDVSTTSVPPLVACPLGAEDPGTVGVFPNSDPTICERLGLARLPDGYEDAATSFAGLREALNERIGRTCVSLDESQGIVRDELDSRGFTDWQVATSSEQSDQAHACVVLGFDLQQRSVLLISSPAPGGGQENGATEPSPSPGG